MSGPASRHENTTTRAHFSGIGTSASSGNDSRAGILGNAGRCARVAAGRQGPIVPASALLIAIPAGLAIGSAQSACAKNSTPTRAALLGIAYECVVEPATGTATSIIVGST